MGIDLPLLWAVIILFAIMMYVVHGRLRPRHRDAVPWFPAKEDRDVMMNTVAPVWDGNETWLVLGGAGPDGGVPARVFGRAERAVPAAGDDAGRADLPRRRLRVPLQDRRRAAQLWDWSFSLGSFARAFFQGVTLGAFIDGIDGRRPVRRRRARLAAAVPAVLRLGWWWPTCCSAAPGW
jgi:cytochrome d ubiquinol oxidase subunit II